MPALDALPRIAELSLEAARRAGSLAVSVARTVAEPVLGRRADDAAHHRRTTAPPPPHASDEAPRPPRAPRPAGPAASAPSPAAPAPAPSAATPAPSAPAAVAAQPAAAEHVDREAVVVAEYADTGAADGAGAQIRVDEPWEGYSRLNAKDVVAQLATADTAMLAVVRLYETANRNRRTVLAEIERRLAAGGG